MFFYYFLCIFQILPFQQNHQFYHRIFEIITLKHQTVNSYLNFKFVKTFCVRYFQVFNDILKTQKTRKVTLKLKTLIYSFQHYILSFGLLLPNTINTTIIIYMSSSSHLKQITKYVHIKPNFTDTADPFIVLISNGRLNTIKYKELIKSNQYIFDFGQFTKFMVTHPGISSVHDMLKLHKGFINKHSNYNEFIDIETEFKIDSQRIAEFNNAIINSVALDSFSGMTPQYLLSYLRRIQITRFALPRLPLTIENVKYNFMF